VLAIRFSVPLAEERLIADCKDRKKPRPFERILWTRGLATFAQADRSVVVVPRVPWQARDFGAQGDVEIMEAKEVSDGKSEHEAIDRSYGDADPVLDRVTILRRQRVQQQDGTLAKDLGNEDLKLRQMLIVGHPLTNLNRVIRTLSSVGQRADQGSEDARWLKLRTCYNAAVVARVMLLRFACETKWTPETEWSVYARKKLTYGDVPPHKARQLAKLALDRDFFEGLPSPEYTDEIVSVIGALISQPAVAAFVPQALDFRLFGQELSSEDGSESLTGILYPDSVRLGKRVLSTLSYAADVHANLWEADESVRGSEVPTDHGPSPKLQ
jgi:hypothetical protein